MLNTQKFNTGKFNIVENSAAGQASASFIQSSSMTAMASLFYAASAIANAEGLLSATEYSRTKQAQLDKIEAMSELFVRCYKLVFIYPYAVESISGMMAQTAAVYGVDIMSCRTWY